jgi:adenylyltransferase/sulfurtransferase
VNDVAVILGVPLISASALKTDGQLSVLNYKGGPCYRCLFPIPPPPSSVTSCGDGGILGPVVGIMGVQQATEAIKVITGAYDKEFKPFLMIYSAYSFPPVRCVSLRGRKATCAVCGDAPSICQDSISRGEVDYAEFCGTLNQSILSAKERVSAKVGDLFSITSSSFTG